MAGRRLVVCCPLRPKLPKASADMMSAFESGRASQDRPQWAQISRDLSWPGAANLFPGEIGSEADIDVGAAVGHFRPTGDIHDRIARRAAPPESGRSGPVWPRGNDLRLKGLVTVARLAILGWGRSRMPQPHRSALGSLIVIAIVIGAGAAAFAYTAGWFSPERLTPTKLVDALAPADRAVARSSPQPCQGHLLYRRVRSERGRIRAVQGPGFRPRAVSGARPLQSCDRRCERAGRDGPRARIGNTDRDAGRPGMA